MILFELHQVVQPDGPHHLFSECPHVEGGMPGMRLLNVLIDLERTDTITKGQGFVKPCPSLDVTLGYLHPKSENYS